MAETSTVFPYNLLTFFAWPKDKHFFELLNPQFYKLARKMMIWFCDSETGILNNRSIDM